MPNAALRRSEMARNSFGAKAAFLSDGLNYAEGKVNHSSEYLWFILCGGINNRLHAGKSDNSYKSVAYNHNMHHIGCSGWQYEGWRELFYPAGLQKNLWLGHYSQKFDSVEANSTHYSWPTERSLSLWRSTTPMGFTISLKANRQITRMENPNEASGLMDRFYALADSLDEKLGCILFELPPSMEFDADWLRSLVSQMDKGHRNAIEFRDKSWWNAEAFSALERRNIAFCSSSAPGLPETFRATADFAYARFHGSKRWYDYNYPKAELGKWAQKMRLFNGDSYAYFNNDMYAHAVENAAQFREMLKSKKVRKIGRGGKGEKGSDGDSAKRV